jgi:hypothetical protein
MCNIVDVLDEQIQRVDWTLVDPSDPLCFISKGHRKFHDMTGNTVRVECTNKHYSGTRGGPIIGYNTSKIIHLCTRTSCH